MAGRAKSKAARKAKPKAKAPKHASVIANKLGRAIGSAQKRRPRPIDRATIRAALNDAAGEGLSVKEENFIREYLANNGNGTDAVIAAGYNCSTRESAAVQASCLLRKPNVAAKLVEARAAIANKYEAKREDVVRWLHETMQDAAVADNLNARLQAIKMIGQTIQMFGSKVELSGPNGGPIATDSTIGPRGLSDELANEIRTKILGVHPRHLFTPPTEQNATADDEPKASE